MIVLELWSKMQGAYFCISTKNEDKQWKDHYFARDELHTVPAFLKKKSDCDLYFCVHGLKTKSRKKESAVLPKMAWADLDEADPEEISPTPSIAFESSPGRYVGFWMLDKPVTEEFNRALTQHVGADPSGYDLGQVLRIPGTRNYKYKNTPKVKLLWDDEPGIRFDQWEPKLKKYYLPDRVTPVANKRQEIFNKYSKSLHSDVKNLISAYRPTHDEDRSRLIYKMSAHLHGAGASREEILEILKHHPLNKFGDKYNSDKKLMDDIDRGIKKEGGPEGLVLNTDLEDISRFDVKTIEGKEIRNREWWWHGRIPKVGLMMLEGDAGVGKSTALMSMLVDLIEQRELPDGNPHDITSKNFKVLYVDNENELETDTVSRLRSMGLRREENFRIIAAHSHDELKEARAKGIVLDNDLDLSADSDFTQFKFMLARERPNIVVFDVLNNYTGALDDNKANDVKILCEKLKAIAIEFDCVVLGIRHINKNNTYNAQARGNGSYKFKASCRVVLGIGHHPDLANHRMLAVIKGNNTAAKMAVTFSMKKKMEKGFERLDFKWVGVEDEAHESDLYNFEAKNSDTSNKAVQNFLKKMLRDGPVIVDKIRKASAGHGYTSEALDEAFSYLDIVVTGKLKKYWSLPDESRHD